MSWGGFKGWLAGGLMAGAVSSCSNRESQSWESAGFAEPEPNKFAETEPLAEVTPSEPEEAEHPPPADAPSEPQRPAEQPRDMRPAMDAADHAPAPPPDCELIDRLVAAPAAQIINAAPSAIQLLLMPGITPNSIAWVFSPSSSARGTLSRPAPIAGEQVSFDCETNGTAEIIATVHALRGGIACVASARTVIECKDQPTPPASDPCTGASCLRPSLGMCGRCALDNCASQIAQVNDHLDAVEPILTCVLGKDWPSGERTSTSSCGNSDLLGCYCGGTGAPDCAAAAPAALDGACRDQLLAGADCQDSACLQTSLLDASNATGKAMLYLQCTQDFCYDFCFNP
jgi:hypothetical protein